MAETLKFPNVPEGMDPNTAINRHLWGRRRRTVGSMLKWGLGTLAAGIGLFAVGALAAPLVPVTAASVLAFGIADATAKFLTVAGAIGGAAGIGASVVESQRAY